MKAQLPPFLVAALFITALAIGGESTPKTSAETAKASGQAVKKAQIDFSKIEIKRGMPSASVKALLGEPKEISPMKAPEGIFAEVWTYRRTLKENTRQVITGMRSVPAFDATTQKGETGTRSEPIYQMQRTTSEEVLKILMVNGVLQESKRNVVDESSFF